MAELVQLLPTALGFYDALGTGEGGGVGIDPDGTGENFVWSVQWTEYIFSDLVTRDNTSGGITNSYLELAALVLQESCFLIICSRPDWHAPLTGSNNMPTVSLCFREASTVNTIVANLLCIRAETNSGDLLTLSVFYQPGPLNTMADDSS